MATLVLSDGFVKAQAGGMSVYDILEGGYCEVYTGSMPSTVDANSAPTGTKLFTATVSGTAFVAEIRATAAILFTGTVGTVSAVTVAGVNILPSTATFATTLAALATDVALRINSARNQFGVTAAASGDTCTIYAPKGSAALWNGIAVTCTSAGGITNTINGAGADTFLSGAADTAGLTFTYPATTHVVAGTGTWQDSSADSSGTAGWARFICGHRYTGAGDSGASDVNGEFMRLDCDIATSGATMTVANTSVAAGAPQVITSFALTVPKA